VGSFWGPVVGAGLFASIAYATRTLVGLSELIVGTGLLAIILLAPNGAVGLWRQLEERLWRRWGAAPAHRPAADATPAMPMAALKQEVSR